MNDDRKDRPGYDLAKNRALEKTFMKHKNQTETRSQTPKLMDADQMTLELAQTTWRIDP